MKGNPQQTLRTGVMCCCKIGFWKTGYKLVHRFGSREELGDGSCVEKEKSEGGRVKNKTEGRVSCAIRPWGSKAAGDCPAVTLSQGRLPRGSAPKNPGGGCTGVTRRSQGAGRGCADRVGCITRAAGRSEAPAGGSRWACLTLGCLDLV